jgi:catecholate siderophore receptor
MRSEAKKGSAKKRRKARRHGAKHWVITVSAVGMLVAYSAGSSRAVTLQYLRSGVPGIGSAFLEVQSQQTQRFDIPPGILGEVLAAFERVTGLKVEVPNEKIRELSSPGVSGIYSNEQALKQLLAGTGVSYSFADSRLVKLEIQAQSETVEVEGGAVQLSSRKYTEPLRDTPQTITVIPKEVIEQQGATTLRDVLRNVPGLTVTAGEGGTPAGDNLTIRGFSARNDVFVDGVRDLGPQSRDPFNLEQVEVVKGPGSAYTGRGSTGGSVNLVSKVASLRPAYGFTLDLGTARTKRATADLNFPLARLGLGDHSAFRLNLLAHDAGVAGRNVVENERWGVAPSLAFGLGRATRLTLSYFHLQQNNISDYGIPWVPIANNALVEFRDKPAPVPRETFYGFKNRDAEKMRSDLATVRFEHDFNDNLSLRNQFRYGNSTRDSIASPPRFISNDSTAINRELRSWLTEDTVWDNQSDVQASFATGTVEHSAIMGLALTREGNIRRTRNGQNSPTTLLNPNPNDVYPGVITTNAIAGDISANSQGLYVFDTAKLGKMWELNGGLRWDRFDAAGITAPTATAPGVQIARVDTMLSFRGGVVFKPKPQGSIYASYGTALNPSLEGLSYGTANTAIDPEKTYTFEAGSKWDFLGGRLLLTGAGFRVEKTNARTPGLPSEPVQVLQGRQRVSGVELSATGSFTRAWQIFSAYTFLDSETIESNTAGELGKELVNTPRNSFNLWTTYELPRRLNLGGGLRFIGRRFGNTINTRFVEGYWTADLMASYPLTNHVDLRLNIYNLTDEYYFDRLAGGHLIPGTGRSATVSLGFKF